MAVLGIITCEVLESEFAELLGTDAEVERIGVLEDAWSARLITLLEARVPEKLVRLPHARAFRAEPAARLEVLVRVVELGQHRRRAVLRAALAAAARELRPHIAAVLLGYGLCGNALDDPRAVLDLDIPVFLPNEGGRPVDDCVGLCLGGHARYCAELRRVPGTFFLTPGWARHWRRGLVPESGGCRAGLARRILAGYERALVIREAPAGDDEQNRGAEEFCHETGLRPESCDGSLDLQRAAWCAAKCALPAASGGSERGMRG